MEAIVDSHILQSTRLGRAVTIDFYFPPAVPQPTGELPLLLINDGQDLVRMDFPSIINRLYTDDLLQPILCVGIHCSANRREEYGVASTLDYKGRGTLAAAYQAFVMEELIPFVREETGISSFSHKSIAGFSMGGLSALDTVWNHPTEFLAAGVFSGSLWWRSRAQEDPLFDEEKHRIMHNLIREGGYYPWLKFFFSTGTLDETADRNQNGIIDSIDDTLALIRELEAKGYSPGTDINYLLMEDGRHDVPTWARALPVFLLWLWRKEQGTAQG